MKENKTILLLEDDDVDYMTVKRAFRELKVSNPFQRAVNGEEGLAYLRDDAHEKPGIILLDLNMPKMNGVEFLKIIKADEDLKKIPVIVLTTSKEDEDRIESFNLSVAGYMLKPVDYEQFVGVIKKIRDYWNMSEMPE